jgi:hypothetical protein
MRHLGTLDADGPLIVSNKVGVDYVWSTAISVIKATIRLKHQRFELFGNKWLQMFSGILGVESSASGAWM